MNTFCYYKRKENIQLKDRLANQSQLEGVLLVVLINILHTSVYQSINQSLMLDNNYYWLPLVHNKNRYTDQHLVNYSYYVTITFKRIFDFIDVCLIDLHQYQQEQLTGKCSFTILG